MTPPDELLKLCEKFIEDNAILNADTVYQCDCVSSNALEFIEQVCELVGYYQEDVK